MQEGNSKSKPKSNRLTSLDVGRGLAAGLVLLTHCMEASVRPFAERIEAYFSTGLCGVMLFFFISGFVIPLSMDRVKTLKSFWISRFFRLFPIYWLSLILGVLLIVVAPKVATQEVLDNLLGISLLNVTMVQELFKQPSILPLYWTLGYEMLFYILISVLFIFNRHRQAHFLLVPLAIFLGVSGIISVVQEQHIGTFRVMLLTIFFSGSLAYRIREGSVSKPVQWILIGLTAVGATIGWYGTRYLEPIPDLFSSNHAAEGIAILVAIVLFVALLRAKDVTFPPVLLWLGKISYSLYLSHSLVIRAFYATNIQLHPIFHFLVIFTLSFPFAVLLHRFVELPSQELGRRLAKRA